MNTSGRSKVPGITLLLLDLEGSYLLSSPPPLSTLGRRGRMPNYGFTVMPKCNLMMSLLTCLSHDALFSRGRSACSPHIHYVLIHSRALVHDTCTKRTRFFRRWSFRQKSCQCRVTLKIQPWRWFRYPLKSFVVYVPCLTNRACSWSIYQSDSRFDPLRQSRALCPN